MSPTGHKQTFALHPQAFKTLMDRRDFDSYAQAAVTDVIAFAKFVQVSEHLFADSADFGALERYRKAWFEAEVINAVALDEWETDGRPPTWDTKWRRYQPEAEQVVALLQDAASALA